MLSIKCELYFFFFALGNHYWPCILLYNCLVSQVCSSPLS